MARCTWSRAPCFPLAVQRFLDHLCTGCLPLQVGQRRFVLLFLYMAVQGGGVVSSKSVMSSARRLRVT